MGKLFFGLLLVSLLAVAVAVAVAAAVDIAFSVGVAVDTRTYQAHTFFAVSAAVVGAAVAGSSYRWLGAGVIEGMSDGDRFVQTKKALDVIGMSEKEVSELLSAVSGVLHLGQASLFFSSVFSISSWSFRKRRTVQGI